MGAPNTQVSPLKHHLKGSNSFPSFRNHSRIQSEVLREGSEIHKENLLSLSSSKSGKHFGVGGKTDMVASSGSQQGGHACTQVSKPALPMVMCMEMGHGSYAQDHGNDQYHMVSRVSESVTRLDAAGTAKNLCIVEPASMSVAHKSLTLDGEAINTYSLHAEMFPQACTSISACTPISGTHREKEPTIEEHMKVVRFLSHASNGEDEQEEDAKRLKYTANMGTTSLGLFDTQIYKQRNASWYALNGSKVSTAIEGAIQGAMGENCAFTCTYKRGDRAACATSHPVDPSKALSAHGLMPFTATAHAHMPEAMLTFSEGEPSLPLSSEPSQQQASNRSQKNLLHESTCTDADWGRFLALSATPIADEMGIVRTAVLPFQNRFKYLQAFLKRCDETDQNECIQGLRSLSAAARSDHAVELETRAIRLSLEEGKEIKRMKLLDVLGKVPEQRLDDAGATPHGPRLPAPGATAKLKTLT